MYSEKTTEEKLKNIEFAYELHDFQMGRLVRLLEVLKGKFGDKVFEVIKKTDVDYEELIAWYLKRTVSIIDALKDNFGDEVIELIKASETENAYKEGSQMACRCGNNTLKDLVQTWGKNEETYLDEKTVLLKREGGCPISKISRELGINTSVYLLSCYTDPCIVKGFNKNLNCEVVKSHMLGDDYCEWKMCEN